MTLTPAELNVDQTTQLVAEQFEVALNGSDAFFSGPADFATIDTGLLDQNLAENLVRALTGGVVDEAELHVGPDKNTSVVRGRGKAALAADTVVNAVYVMGPTSPAAKQPTAIPGFPTLPVTPGVTVPLVVTGKQWASDIAADLCTKAGLGCSYGAHDYRMREDFAVNESVSSAVQRLTAPFSQFEPSKVDVWEENGTLVVRQRDAVGAAMALDAHDARITELVIKDASLGLVRVLRITGSRTGTGSPYVASTGGFGDRSSTDETEVDGVVTSRIVTREHYRVLDGAVLEQSIDTYLFDEDALSGNSLGALVLVSSVQTNSDWDDLEIAPPNQIVNSPKERGRVILTSAPSADTGAMEPTKRTRIASAYDPDGYLVSQATTVEEFDPTLDTGDGGLGGWTLDSQETKQYRRSATGQYQITTTQYGADGAPGQVRRTSANGTPPGGPGRRQAQTAETTTEPVVYAAVISLAPGAKDVTIADNNLLPEHLAVITAQATQASGGKEREISFTAAGLPWIRRGQFIQITGFEDEYGTPRAFAPALVSEARLEYRESSDGPTYTTYVRALSWS